MLESRSLKRDASLGAPLLETLSRILFPIPRSCFLRSSMLSRHSTRHACGDHIVLGVVGILGDSYQATSVVATGMLNHGIES